MKATTTSSAVVANTAIITKCALKYLKAYSASFFAEKAEMEGSHRTKTGNLIHDFSSHVLPNAFYDTATGEYIFNHAMLRMPQNFVGIIALHEEGHKALHHTGGLRVTRQELEADKYALERTTDKEAIELMIGFLVFNSVAPLVLGALLSATLYSRLFVIGNLISSLVLTGKSNLEVIARIEQALPYLRK